MPNTSSVKICRDCPLDIDSIQTEILALQSELAAFEVTLTALEAGAVLGKASLTTIHAIPFVTSAGTLGQDTLLLDSVNKRIYFDGPFNTSVVAGTGRSVIIGGNNQFGSVFKVSQPNAGTAIWEINSTALTGAVGGGAFIRAADGATIGVGYQTAAAATWDLDLLGTSSGVGAGYDFSINNKNVAASLRLQGGISVIFGIGIGEVVPQIAQFDIDGLTFSAGKGIREAIASLAMTGTNQGTASLIVSRTTLLTGANGTVGSILPATPTAGDVYVLINTGGANANVYPGAGDQINAAGANNPLVMAAGRTSVIRATSASQWWAS